VVVSVPDQKLALYRKGQLVQLYDVSTSKFCVSNRQGSYGTPLGAHEVAKKIGGDQPKGMKFSSRRPTGEIVAPNSPGRDPIVSRILWLNGLERGNRNSYGRCIYIHGTAEEWRIGTPASYGCIRMRSRDVINLYSTIGVGAKVEIVNQPLALPAAEPETHVHAIRIAHVSGTQAAPQ
jgi:lipoprotein-anchoring transpeptidase ErfK/SrfK